MNRPLLSILIATRNRQETASIVISEILNLNLPNLEVVVSDTSQEVSLPDLIRSKTSYSNYVYQHTAVSLSMSENYSKAIDMSSGEYICMIGDDDFVLPNIIEIAQYAKLKDLDSVTQRIWINFNWLNEQNGMLFGQHPTKSAIEKIKTKSALNWILLKGGMMTIDAPRLYHGMVKRSIFESLKIETGQYFFGTSPDISATVSICCRSQFYGYSSCQFTVPGASIKSNSNLGLRKVAPKIDESDHVALHKHESWPDFIPPILCAETNWPEATHKTLLANNHTSSKVNLAYCYLLMYFKYRTQSKLITPSLYRHLDMTRFTDICVIPLKLITIASYIIYHKAKRKLHGNFFESKVPPSISKISSIVSCKI